VDSTGFTLPSKLYDFLKWIALVFLPGLAALYAALGSLWEFPAIVQVVGSVTAFDTFLGLLLKRSSSNYRPPEMMGDFIVKVDEHGEAAGMKIEATKEFVPNEGDTISFRVKRQQTLK
jgi:uncharacterized protein YuzE